ncbi:MAG: GntR family transcriptional regulator [Candidatus Rifleibacteriota bacterium]
MIRINESSPIPIYLQIVEEVRRMILSRTLETDDRLPSIRQIAGDLKVNPNTVAKAFQELETLNLIYFKRGQGAFVAPIAKEDQKMQIIADLNTKLTEIVKLAVEMGLKPAEISNIFKNVLETVSRQEEN